MQNKLCSSTELIKKDTKVIGYEIIIENVLNILLFPKILYIGKNKFGEYGTMIFEEFMQFGILSSIQVFEQVKNKIEKTRKFNNAMMNKIKVTFINLIESNYIVQAQKVTNALKERTREIVNRNLTKPKRNNKSKDNEDKKSKSKKKNKKKEESEEEDDGDFQLLSSKKENKKKARQSKKKKETEVIEHLSASEDDDLQNDFSSDNEEEKKNPLDDKIVNDNDALLFNKESSTFFYFFFNYEQIIADMKSQIVIEFINQKISPQAGAIASLFLEKNQIASFKNGKTIGLSYTSISSKYKSININSIDEIVADPNDFFIKISNDTYSLNLEKVNHYYNGSFHRMYETAGTVSSRFLS